MERLSSFVTRRRLGFVLLPVVLFWYFKNLPAIVSSPGTVMGAHIGMAGWVLLLVFLFTSKSSENPSSPASARIGKIMGYGFYVLVLGVLFFGYQEEPLREADPRREMLREMDVPFDPYQATDEEITSFLKEMSPPAQAETPSDEWLDAFTSCIIANLKPEVYQQIRSQPIVRLTEDFAKTVPGYCAGITFTPTT
jgi:hypothetical protein